MNTTDAEDGESSHTVVVQYRATSGGWKTSYLSTVWYDSSESRWETNFTPTTSAITGDYDIRIMVNDTDGSSTGWSTYSDVLTVTNNNPLFQNYTLSRDSVERTNTTIISVNSTDIEDVESLHTITIELRSPDGSWSTDDLSTIWYNSSSSSWETNFTPSTTAELGLYDLRIMVNDTDDATTNWSVYDDAVTVSSNPPILTDYSVINYAKENGMILITRDTESGQACEENNLPCILLDNEAIFKIVTEKLQNF